MGRPVGSRNADFEATRDALVRAVRARLAEQDGARASFRELAAAANVSVATLRHYFGTREGVINAVLQADHRLGKPYLEQVAAEPSAPLRESCVWLLQAIAAGFLHGGLAEVHSIGLASGLRNRELGPSYLNEVLEPTLQALEGRLKRHEARGELRPCDHRVAALALLAPALMALLHQSELGGSTCRALDIGAYIEAHVDGFVRAYGVRSTDDPADNLPSRSQQN